MMELPLMRQCHSAISDLHARDPGYQITQLPLRRRPQEVVILGLRDVDEDRNLGDYQNVTYFVLADDLEELRRIEKERII